MPALRNPAWHAKCFTELARNLLWSALARNVLHQAGTQNATQIWHAKCCANLARNVLRRAMARNVLHKAGTQNATSPGASAFGERLSCGRRGPETRADYVVGLYCTGFLSSLTFPGGGKAINMTTGRGT